MIVVVVVVVVVAAVMVSCGVVVAFSMRTRRQHATRHENGHVPSETVNCGCGSTVWERVLPRDTAV